MDWRDCCDGGFRINGGGTNVVRSNSFSSLLTVVVKVGRGDRSISLTYLAELDCCSSNVLGRRETVTLMCPGWISRRTASCRIAAASRLDRLTSDESLMIRIWSFGRSRLSCRRKERWRASGSGCGWTYSRCRSTRENTLGKDAKIDRLPIDNRSFAFQSDTQTSWRGIIQRNIECHQLSIGLIREIVIDLHILVGLHRISSVTRENRSIDPTTSWDVDPSRCREMHSSTVSPIRVSRNKATVSCNDIWVTSIEFTDRRRSPRWRCPFSMAAPLRKIVLT